MFPSIHVLRSAPTERSSMFSSAIISNGRDAGSSDSASSTTNNPRLVNLLGGAGFRFTITTGNRRGFAEESDDKGLDGWDTRGNDGSVDFDSRPLMGLGRFPSDVLADLGDRTNCYDTKNRANTSA